MPSQCHPSKFIYTPEQIGSVLALISQDRFCRYLTASKGDEREALRRYEHNTALSESLYGVLQGFEIALRNSIHNTMTRETGMADWFDHFDLDGAEIDSVTEAKGKILRKRNIVTPSCVVAELTFGFWVALIARHYDARLWVPHLHKAFPSKNLQRRPTHKRLSVIRLLRNSVAHHECILHRDLAQQYREIIEAATWICRDTATWIRRTTRFEACYRLLFKTDILPPPPALQ